MTSAAVSGDDGEAGGDGDSAGADAQKTGEKDADDSWHPFKDIKFNEVSARPGKKPYERRREVNDPE